MHFKLKSIVPIISGTLLMASNPGFSKTLIAGYESNKSDTSVSSIAIEKTMKTLSAESVLGLLKSNAQQLNLENVISTLQFDKQKESLSANHFHFKQVINGVPVFRKEVIVSINKSSTTRAKVFSHSFDIVHDVPAAKISLSESEVLEKSWNKLQSSGKLTAKPSAKLVYVPSGKQLVLAYVTVMNVTEPGGEWQQIIAAESGEVISIQRTDLPTFKNANAAALNGKWVFANNKQQRSFSEVMNEYLAKPVVAKSSSSAALADATAQVFDPDPRTTLNNDTLEDTSPASSFTAAYQTRTLRDVTLSNGIYSLTGPWVTIANFDAGDSASAEAPSTSNTGTWTQTRGDNAFNDANTYFHLDQNQRYMQSLGFTGATGIQFGSIQADTNGAGGDDNSFFSPSANQLVFGHGCVDDNEDADVILHEYGHAINHSINNNWVGGDTGAMGEGFGDYWAGSYSYSTPNGSFNAEKVFSWDGHNNCWNGRVMNQTGFSYDSTQSYGAHQSVNGELSDELWSTPLFQSLVQLIDQGRTREEVDQIILEAQFGLGANLTMPLVAVATVQAAQTLFPTGPHAGVFENNFKQVNILGSSVSATGLTVSNTGANGAADPGETVDVVVPLNNGGAFSMTGISAQMTTSTSNVTLPNGTSAYPDIAAAATENNTTAFQVAIPESHSCGDPVNLSMAVSFNQNGAVENETFDFAVNTGVRSQISQTSSPAIAIPDNNRTGITSTINLSNAGTAIDSNFGVDLSISHTFRGDLIISLTSPEGTTVALTSQSNDGTTNLIGSFPGDFDPVGDFSDFQGESLNGIWTLTVADGAAVDEGTLNSWTLKAGGAANCNGQAQNQAPSVSVAQSSIVVNGGAQVTLDASATTDPEGDNISFQWVQTSGPSVTLSNANTSTASFTAPQVNASTAYVFQVTATDTQNASSNSTVTVTVNSDSTGTGAGGGGGGSVGIWFALLGLLSFRRKSKR